MTFNLLIEYKNGESDFVPLAGHVSFIDAWLPLCARLNLKFLTQAFEGELDVLGVLPELLDEMHLLRNYISQARSAQDSVNISENMVLKIQTLTEKLEFIHQNLDEIEDVSLG